MILSVMPEWTWAPLWGAQVPQCLGGECRRLLLLLVFAFGGVEEVDGVGGDLHAVAGAVVGGFPAGGF